MRFLFSIEISWDDNIIWFESLLKLQACCKYLVNMLKFDDLKNRYNRDFRIEIWSLKKHCDRDFRIRNIIHFDSYQSALKIWKSFSWVTQKKHDLMISLFAVFDIENLISYNSQFSIWWLTADWLTKRSNSSFSLFFHLFIFHIGIEMLQDCRRNKIE